VALLVIPFAGLYIVCSAWLAWWMLEPINRVAGQLQLSTRFVLTDVLGLMVLLQLPLALLGRAINTGRERSSSPYWLLLAVGICLALVLWAASVSVVSRAGITRLWQRLCVIVLLVPGTLIVMIAVPGAVIGLVVGLAVVREDSRPPALAGLLLIALGAAVLVIRRLAFWALRNSPGEAALAALVAGRLALPATTMLAPSPPAPVQADREP
jgi:hypothetical protein